MSEALTLHSATISPCERYRWNLSRHISTDGVGDVAFLMLNPSTADAYVDDPTIRRCMGFARAWGYERMWVINLYALRTPSPREMMTYPQRIGDQNDETIAEVAMCCDAVICAWGSNGEPERIAQVLDIVRKAGTDLFCLGKNKDGNPKHPLYLPKTAQRIPYP